jgi:hypothetical protein
MKKAIFAASHSYNAPFKLGDHHYAELLSKKGYEILWLSPPINFLFKLKDTEQYKKDYQLYKMGPIEVAENIYEYTPYTLLPYISKRPLDSFWVAKNSLRFCIKSISKCLAEVGFSSIDLLWLSNPKYAYIDKYVSYKCLVHRMADDLSKFEGIAKSIVKVERNVINKADLLYVTSKNLIKAIDKKGSMITYLPNGCDYNHFQLTEYIIPMELERYKDKKIVIYIGAIDSWFDVELMKYCALDNLEMEFFIIGTDKINIEHMLKDIKNVHILGKRDYGIIPQYLHSSDVGIIPFKKNELTVSVNPIKLFEYCAAGIPTISSEMSEVNDIVKSNNLPIYIAQDKKEFSTLLKQVDKRDINRNALKEFGKANTWNRRVEQVISDVEGFINNNY